jgi:hypothetical protein
MLIETSSKEEDDEIRKEIQKFLEEFGEKVNEIKYDGWPVWWFFKVEFLKDSLPPQFSRQEKIAKSILNDKKLSIKEKIESSLKIFFIRKYIQYNEKSKFWISRFNHKEKPLLKKDKNRVMFLAHTNAILFKNSDENFEVDRIETVIREVRKDPQLEEYVSIIDPLSHNSKLKLLKYPNLVYKFIDAEIQKKANRSSHILNKKWNEIRDKLKFNSKIKTKILEHFKPALDFYFSKEFIYITVLYYETYKKIIREKEIKLLSLYASSRLIIRCAIAAADKEEIPSIHILHGIGLSRVKTDLPSSTHYLVPGEAFKKELIKLGVNRENIRVIGAVFLDTILEYTSKKRKKEKKQKEVLFLTSPYVEFNYLDKDYYFACIRKLLKEFKTLPKVHFLIKLHPNEKYMKEYQSLIRTLKCNNVDVIQNQSKESLYSLITNSDLFISFGSTATIEAMILDKPTINIILIKNEDLLEFDPVSMDLDSGVHVKSIENTGEKIKKCLFDRKTRKKLKNARKRFKRSYLYKVDGNAGKRTVDVIKNLIGK